MGALPAPTVAAGAVVTPAQIAAVAALPAVTVAAGVVVTPAQVAAVAPGHHPDEGNVVIDGVAIYDFKEAADGAPIMHGLVKYRRLNYLSTQWK